MSNKAINICWVISALQILQVQDKNGEYLQVLILNTANWPITRYSPRQFKLCRLLYFCLKATLNRSFVVAFGMLDVQIGGRNSTGSENN